ncbi:MAG: hypothetical protein CMH98_21560 [Oceanospirillaceae bacterium]|nr:hypothetical protein [Oceanospirillaceae bacterium]|tara:strand:+ start:46231 stop:48483 length:2253 start_codon:yes stop_codon:yes gene_type:complete
MGRSTTRKNLALAVLPAVPVFVSAFAPAITVAAEESLLFEPDIPQVLTPVRLQQPLAEVPASVTVITAEQLRLWGVQDLASAFRFVPGMFVSRELSSNSATVLYHSGDVSLARRLEVLVDGRSVYKASFANVDWDQLNIAPEDVERIEITRGPSASSYGMNAFQGVIHIITRHPADSSQARVTAEYGAQQRRHAYASVTQIAPDHQQRLSAFGWREGEFGEYHADGGDVGGVPDLRQVKGINLSGAWQSGLDSSLRWQVGRQSLQRDQLADSNFQVNSPRQESISDVGWVKWNKQVSPDHELHLQAYWQGENNEVDYRGCAPSMAFDARLAGLYRANPELMNHLAGALLSLQEPGLDPSDRANIEQAFTGLALGVIDAGGLTALSGIPVSANDYQVIQQVAQQMMGANALYEITCGDGDTDIYEQRTDFELQDTVRWSDTLRTVQGIGYRQDKVASETFMGGTVRSDQWLAFVNAEYRPLAPLLVSAAAMVEYDSENPLRFSPRLGMNYLFGQQQSVRLQVSRSRRSPDLAERYLQTSAGLSHMTSNYLNQDNGALFYNASADSWRDDLNDERLFAWEVGYYGYFYRSSLQINVKYFEEHMDDLISTRVTLNSTSLANQGGMNIRGLEGQVNWQPAYGQSLMLGWLLQDREADRASELILGAEQAFRLMWTRRAAGFEQSLGAVYDRNVLNDGGGSRKGAYQQKKLIWRLAADTAAGQFYWAGTYDALYDQVLYDNTPRWLNRLGWNYEW